MNKHLAGLDHLRALAVILVVLYHYSLFGHPAYLHETIGNFGWTGVDLFFVLSGYLIGGQLLSRVARNQPVDYGTFYLKRFLRIIPAYLAVLILYFTIPAFTERSTLPPYYYSASCSLASHGGSCSKIGNTASSVPSPAIR